MGTAKQTEKMKAGIYSPYLDVLGGGERYILSIAEALQDDFDLYIFSDPKVADKIRTAFGMDTSGWRFLSPDLVAQNSPLGKLKITSGFNLFFYMTDGSIFASGAGKSFLIIQSPVHLPESTLLNKIKMRGWKILCYSSFMGKYIKEKSRYSANVLSPYIDKEIFRSGNTPKENIILTVGRFFREPHSKNHDILIEAFKKGYEKYFFGWKLVIAGGFTEASGEQVLKDLNMLKGNYPIQIRTNLKFPDLVSLYKKSRIYWHAAGFGADLEVNPKRAEHFGITTLEAMAAGNVPVVFAGGGQKDIITNGRTGCFWQTVDELVEKTGRLITDQGFYRKLQKAGYGETEKYSRKNFYEQLKRIISR